MLRKKSIGILQPVYLPWMGYFEQIARVDQFVFMDDVQYTKRDWRNRNRIKTAAGSVWLTVPVVRYSLGTVIKDIEINYEEDWVRSHLRSIEVNYRKTRYFEPLYEDIVEILQSRPSRLIDLNVSLIRMLCGYLGIDTPMVFSSDVPKGDESKVKQVDNSPLERNTRRNRRIIDICHHFGAGLLYDGKKAEEFINIGMFRNEGVEVVFQDYLHPIYRQLFGEFLSHQSVIDLIMNTGPEASSLLRSSPIPERLQLLDMP